MDDAQWVAVSTILESYLLRRAVCGLTTKNYNRVFLGLTRTMRREGANPDLLAKQLREQSGDSAEWPSDEKFAEAWRSKYAYQLLNNPKIVHILKRLSNTYLTGKNEAVTVESALTVEHILPQQWEEKWPLPDGSKGLTTTELWTASKEDPRANASRNRNQALQTFGNLTILTQSLNSSVSNSPWNIKKTELLKHSLLPINQLLHDVLTWDEAAITQRSNDLLARALKVWPHGAFIESAK